MAVTSDIKVEEIELAEDGGVHNSLERKYLVSGISTATSDTRRLTVALATAGVPVAGNAAPGNTNLICVARRARMAPDSNTQAIVTCTYAPVAQSKQTFVFSGGTSLSGITTQNDIYGNQLACSHTWPAEDPDPDYAGQTFIQGANASVLVPSTTLTGTGAIDLEYPDTLSRAYVGATNSTYWAGVEPGYWLCTRCDFENMAAGYGQTKRWLFTFEFQHKIDGWAQRIWYTDPRTGEPAPDLIEGTGIKYFDWYPSINYNILFPNV